MTKLSRVISLLAVSALPLSASVYKEAVELPPELARLTTQKLFCRAVPLMLPAYEEVVYQAATVEPKGKAGFVAWERTGAAELTGEGALRFTLGNKPAVLGWGNYQSKQPLDTLLELGKRFHLSFQTRQSAPVTWVFRPWHEGRRGSTSRASVAKRLTRTSKRAGWHTVLFQNVGAVHRDFKLDGCDGFDLTVTAAPGTTIELRDLKIYRVFHRGCARYEFTLPAGPVWRAIADIGVQCECVINGQAVPSAPVGNLARPLLSRYWTSMRRTQAADIAPYLRAGVNCVGLHATELGREPYVTFRGTIVMGSGAVIRVDSGTSWRFSPAAAHGWAAPGFDDRGWQPIAAKRTTGAAYARADWGLTIKNRFDMPTYDGLMALDVPGETMLYFSADKPVRLHVRIPPGLEAKQPAIEWAVTRFQPRGRLTQVRKGTVSAFEKRDGSLVFALEAAPVTAGVYFLSAALKARGGELLEQRIPEPLVVTARLAMTEVAGDTYEEGMDLEREAVIDCGRPGDPRHPWMEIDGNWKGSNKPRILHTPIVVEKDGMRYRETRPFDGAAISWKYTFKHPGDFYLMELDYPDNRRRLMGVSCGSEMDGIADHSKSGASVWSGIRHPLSGTMQTLKWIYRPDHGAHSINLLSLYPQTPAAAAKITIRHVKNGLPALRINEPRGAKRKLGVLTERTAPVGGFLKTFKCSWRKLPGAFRRYHAKDLAYTPDNNPLYERLEAFSLWLDANNAYTKYLRFTGQNIHIMGCFQYNEMNTGFRGLSPVRDARVVPDCRDVAARVFRDNGIDLLASVEFRHTAALNAEAQRRRGTAGTLYLVDRAGRDVSGVLNFNHPMVWAGMLELADVLAQKFGNLRNFRGINWYTFGASYLIPTYRGRDADALDNGYGDATISAFAKDTGVPLGAGAGAGPGRFAQRHRLLTSEALRDKWVQWRAARLNRLFREIASRVRAVRPDLRLCVGETVGVPLIEGWRESGLTLEQYKRTWGWDCALLRQSPSVEQVHWMTATHSYGFIRQAGKVANLYSYGGPGYPKALEANVCPEFYALLNPSKDRTLMLHYGWIECEFIRDLFEARPGWPRPYQYTMMGSAQGDNSMEPFVQGVIQAEPSNVWFGFTDANMLTGNEQPLRRFARCLRALPADRFAVHDGTGLASALAIRTLRQRGRFYFYVVNPSPWAVTGRLELSRAAAVTNLVTGRAEDKSLVLLRLEPYGLGACVAEPASASIQSWSAPPVRRADVQFVDNRVERAEEMLRNPFAAAALLPDERKAMRKHAAQARGHFERGEYAGAWHIVSDPRFLVLLDGQMRKGMEIAELTTHQTTRGQASTERRAMTAVAAASPPVLDGKLDDACWQRAQPVGGFVFLDGKPALVETVIRGVHCRDTLYLSLLCRDKAPGQARAKATSEMSLFSGDDAVSLLIQPDVGKTGNYYQMAFNPKALRFDQKVAGRARDYKFAPSWQVACAVTPAGWTAEVKLPAAIFQTVLKPGDRWGLNVFRFFRQSRVPASSWSYSPRGAHCPERFGRLQFE